tara:strand:- start:3379 stop:3561 length:183 start_codon:yes stop_codon:yes gene_type:complete
MTSYQYCILVLKKVSFDSNLFFKEYWKATKVVDVEDLEKLQNWCRCFVAQSPHLQSEMSF